MKALDWDDIDGVAADLGAKPYARLQWRQRRIPADWKIKIVETLAKRGKRISFDQLPKGKREAA
jgi:hypothetical protein